MIARLVDHRSDLPNAIALNSLLINCARVVGPAIAGALIATVGEAICFTLNALSFGAVLYALTQMRWPPATSTKPNAGLGGRVGSKARRPLSAFPPIRAGLLMIATISATIGTYSTLMPVFAKDVFGGGARSLGILLSSAGKRGAAVGALSGEPPYDARSRSGNSGRRVLRSAGDARVRARVQLCPRAAVADRAGCRPDRRAGIDTNAGADAGRRRQARPRDEPLYDGVSRSAAVRQPSGRSDSALRGRGRRVR